MTHVMSMPTEECACFENSVKSFLKRQRKGLERKYGSLPTALYDRSVKDAMSITNHASHVLKTLYTKRGSLSNAIKAFDKICSDSLELVKQFQVQSDKSDHSSLLQKTLQEILTHLFAQYIRIRDGFVLLTSGECRHEGDSSLAKKEKRFASRLATLAKRKDGYTSLFSSNCGYSGYGWDEFHNEEVGLRRRLLDALRKCCMYPKQMNAEMEAKFSDGESAPGTRERVWEKLVDSGAELFEASFDNHENQMKELQRQLERNRSKFIEEMERILVPFGGGRLFMITEDKFEKLELKFNSIGFSDFSVQRQGDTFRGKDSRGALPSNCTLGEWIKMMGVPDRLQKVTLKIRHAVANKEISKPAGSKRKRIVIADSDEDSDQEIVTDSLKVTVKQSLKTNTTSGSLSRIKKQLGVNVDELERGREELEAEEKGTKEAAFVDEVGEMFQSSLNRSTIRGINYSEEISELHEAILDEEETVNMLRSVCKKKNKADEEAWDARESLRFSLMTVGILLLDYNGLLQTNQGYSILKKAEGYFQESINTIKQLVQLNNTDIDGEQVDHEFRTRSLLLCSGRAWTNLGKTYFEQSEMLLDGTSGFGGVQRDQYSKLALAVKCFRNAEKDATTLRTKAEKEESYNKSAKFHILDANALLSMTWRFQGFAFLRLMKESVCMKKLRKAAGFDEFNNTETIDPKAQVDEIEAKALLLVEQYNGACSLISISSSLSNRTLQSNTSDSSGEDLQNILIDAYIQAENMSELLEQLSSEHDIVKQIVLQHGIRSKMQIKQLRDEAIQGFLQKKKKHSNLSSLDAVNPSIPSLPRSDLFRNASLAQTEPTGFIVRGSTARKRRDDSDQRKDRPGKKSETDDAFDGFGLHTKVHGYESDGAVQNSILDAMSLPGIQYRKWGDELFEGKEMKADSYPSSVPEKPDEMLLDLQKFGSSTSG